MRAKEFTYLFCLDDKKSYSVEVKRRFNDPSRYKVFVSSSPNELLRIIEQHQSKKCFKVAILPLYEHKDQKLPVRNMAVNMLDISPEIKIILLVHDKDPVDPGADAGFDIYSWVPSNNNSVLRIHNVVKKLLSEMSLEVKRKRMKSALKLLLITCAIAALVVILTWYKSSQLL